MMGSRQKMLMLTGNTVCQHYMHSELQDVISMESTDTRILKKKKLGGLLRSVSQEARRKRSPASCLTHKTLQGALAELLMVSKKVGGDLIPLPEEQKANLWTARKEGRATDHALERGR